MVDRARERAGDAGRRIIRRNAASPSATIPSGRSSRATPDDPKDAARLVLVGSSRLAAQINAVVPAGVIALVDRVQIQQVLVSLMQRRQVLREANNGIRILDHRPAVDGPMVTALPRRGGPGLPPGQQVFQRFSASRTSSGMGISLSISKRIIELRGTFSAGNAPGGGATLRLHHRDARRAGRTT